MATNAERKKTLDHMVDEKFAELFFLAKEEYDVPANSDCERELYDMLNDFKRSIRLYCEKQNNKQQKYLEDFCKRKTNEEIQ